jgi:membrane fusion protein (multidrug efflux system)
MGVRGWIASVLLLVLIVGAGGGLALRKRDSIAAADLAATQQPEPAETVEAAVAGEQQYTRTTTAIGTVVALRSVTLKNELAGTVREAALTPGQIVEEGTVLVALDVAVEEAELKAAQATVALDQSVLGRVERASQNHGASAVDVDRARADLDVAKAQVARTEAIIARKTLRAPFRGRIGLSDVHVGQYLDQGTAITTLQGVDEAVFVDFVVAQTVAERLKAGDAVEIRVRDDSPAVAASVVALDARVDAATRNQVVRAKLEQAGPDFTPGAAVRVRVPTSAPQDAVVVPVSALRKGPDGDHVFVLAEAPDGRQRAHQRAVESGTILGDAVVILSGLKKGETVATAGSFKLHEGGAVVVAPAEGH